jgi:hypothetical protein
MSHILFALLHDGCRQFSHIISNRGIYTCDDEDCSWTYPSHGDGDESEEEEEEEEEEMIVVPQSESFTAAVKLVVGCLKRQGLESGEFTFVVDGDVHKLSLDGCLGGPGEWMVTMYTLPPVNEVQEDQEDPC